MKIFLAGNQKFGMFPAPLSDYKAPYILQSFYDCSGWGGLKNPWPDEMIRRAVTTPDIFLLDSGAFSFLHRGGSVKWDDYLSQYIEFINRWHIKHFFELDLDTIIGVEETRKLTNRLEKETGVKSIPVFHACRGMKRWRQMCIDYDYVAIGASGLTKECRWTRSDKALKAMIKIAHNSGTKVHGLGYTKLANINNTTVPFDSVDSTSWLSGARFATVYKFTGDKLVKRSVKKRSPGRDILNNHNIAEWVKMCRYKARGDN